MAIYANKQAGLRRICALLAALLLAVSAGLLPAAAGGPSDGGTQPEVLLGGMPFGVKFCTQGVLVVGFCDVETGSGARCPARDAGLKERDVLLRVGDRVLNSAADLTAAIEASGGRPVSLTVKRLPDKQARGAQPAELTVTVTPVMCPQEGRYKAGLWVKDSGAGIGTVTFIVPGTLAFAGLGHGICDGETGMLIPMGRGQVTGVTVSGIEKGVGGQVTGVTVSGIEKGVAGDPGSIRGYFDPGKVGTLVGNTPCGVFGIFSSLPAGAGRLVAVADRDAVHDGPASILCTLDDGAVGEYAVRVSSVDKTASGSKCFTVTVTDPSLLSRTGGIVQGMSGSPILQDGHLIGAVTHVLINDPATGYAVFIDNMRRDMPDLLK